MNRPEIRPMIALTVRQPWAWAIIHGGKDIENRSWSWWPRKQALPRVVLVYASAYLKRDEYDVAMPTFKRAGCRAPHYGELVYGAIIGQVTVYDCVPANSVRGNQWAVGPFCWLLRDPVALRHPVGCKGRLGLWTPDPEVVEQLPGWLRETETSVCEHGDHPCAEGRRFCSEACERCEHESTGEDGCDGLCGHRGEP